MDKSKIEAFSLSFSFNFKPVLWENDLMRNSQRPKRNELCPCGSGKKYKHCHGKFEDAVHAEDRCSMKNWKKASYIEERLRALQIQREKQQGLGRPIISELVDGVRYILVGKKLMYSKNWKTFHDFLFDYIKIILGSEWGNSELEKNYSERHPILQWYYEVCDFQQRFFKSGKISTKPMIGVISAYLSLAYNLYLLAHNESIQTRLIGRIKNKDQFLGASYEVFVAATLIKAGFELEFEDEDDASKSHCEFTARYRETGKSYSVEAKARQEGKNHSNVKKQLRSALKKRASFARIIFIDLNIPDREKKEDMSTEFEQALQSIREEESLIIDGKPAPEAYIIVTNRPYQYYLKETDFRVSAFCEGFKMPEFRNEGVFRNIRSYLKTKEIHYEIYKLMESLRTYSNIPATFNGGIPEFEYGEDNVPRMIIGNRYSIPYKDSVVVGVLTCACAIEESKIIYGVYQLEDGKNIICTCPMTDAELEVYKRNSETFFGTYDEGVKQLGGPIDAFDYLFKTYGETEKTKLLEFMKNHYDYNRLKELTQRELAITYCERLAYSMTRSEKDNGLIN